MRVTGVRATRGRHTGTAPSAWTNAHARTGVGEITAVENQVGRGLLQIRQNCFKRRSIPMDVR